MTDCLWKNNCLMRKRISGFYCNVNLVTNKLHLALLWEAFDLLKSLESLRWHELLCLV